jgi:hypothetical protein
MKLTRKDLPEPVVAQQTMLWLGAPLAKKSRETSWPLRPVKISLGSPPEPAKSPWTGSIGVTEGTGAMKSRSRLSRFLPVGVETEGQGGEKEILRIKLSCCMT